MQQEQQEQSLDLATLKQPLSSNDNNNDDDEHDDNNNHVNYVDTAGQTAMHLAADQGAAECLGEFKVAYQGDIAQDAGFIGEQGGYHQFSYSIFSAADLYFSM